MEYLKIFFIDFLGHQVQSLRQM